MATSFSSSKFRLSPLTLPLHHPPFTPIRECEREEKDDEEDEGSTTDVTHARQVEPKHQPTPIHHSDKRSTESARRRTETDVIDDDRWMSCNECLPSNREKFSVAPIDSSNGVSPNGRFKSILFSLTKHSPRLVLRRDEQWKIAVAELSHKLVHAERKRDEAVLEALRIKHSMAELENKLNKLEVHCHDLKSELEICTNQPPCRSINPCSKQNQHITIVNEDKVIEHFLVCVSESRTSVRLLSRSLTLQLNQMGPKICDRISLLLQPYEIKVSLSKNPRAITFYLEALLNRAFFEDFESIGFRKSSSNQILNPIARCESNFASFNNLQCLFWEDVLNKGTRHFSDEFSRFCDRKMSEIVAMLGWNKAWREPLLQAFFVASKSVWLAHLLANSVHPGLPILRVDNGCGFDPIYMEDMGDDRARKLVPDVVRIMITPGFYVYGNVVKCKVVCRYHYSGNNSACGEKG